MHDYTHTLRRPVTAFPYRGLDSLPSSTRPVAGSDAVRNDKQRLSAVQGLEDVDRAYSELRLAFRWMLGCLHHRAGKSRGRMEPLERYMLDLAHRKLQGDFQQAFSFVSKDLRRFYFDVTKDALFCGTRDCPDRLSALALMPHLVDVLVCKFEHVMPHVCGEAREHVEEMDLGPQAPVLGVQNGPVSPFEWEKVRTLREGVLKRLESMRMQKLLQTSLDAHVEVSAADLGMLENASVRDPGRLLSVSEVSAMKDESSECEFSVHLSERHRCERSFRRCPTVGMDAEFPSLSLRDALAVREQLD